MNLHFQVTVEISLRRTQAKIILESIARLNQNDDIRSLSLSYKKPDIYKIRNILSTNIAFFFFLFPSNYNINTKCTAYPMLQHNMYTYAEHRLKSEMNSHI